MAICPRCGETQSRFEISSSGGTQAYTMCCDTPLEIVDNWDVYESLPEDMQEAAIAQIREQWVEMDRKTKQDGERFKANYDRWYATLEKLERKGDQLWH